ncbi:hypothetical protein TRAPUB_10204 [Trametes pubescens]|uniref:F-box domain-containing protein n=1 Tax=Trametes pubescens TaxID=154538 RepID=A0A1M2W075_TRAPU|nr:hypothetical protein TRAPUB_10204 [Trametes pubescens]
MAKPDTGLGEPSPNVPVSLARAGILAARAELFEQKEAFERKILHNSFLLNATVPINMLPEELLIEIFCYTLIHDVSRSQSGGRWYRILAVCRNWHTIACRAATLWTNITIGRSRLNTIPLETFLSRSQLVPLDVTVRSPDQPDIAALVPHLPRTRSLNVGPSMGPEHAALMEKVLTPAFAMPKLHTLIAGFEHEVDPVESDNDIYYSDDEEPFRDPDNFTYRYGEVLCIPLSTELYPHLRNLSLTTISFIPPATPFTTLRRLELRQCISYTLCRADFLQFLSASTVLEELVLHKFRPYVGFLHTDTQGGAPLVPVALSPALQTLVVEDMPSYNARMLEGLKVPPTTNLSIAALHDPHDPCEDRSSIVASQEPLSKSLPPNMDNLSMVHNVDVVHLHLLHEAASAPRRIRLTGRAAKYTIDLYAPLPWNNEQGSNIVQDLADIFGNSPVVELLITRLDDIWYKSCCHTEQWSRTLLRFPYLQRLAVTPIPYGFRGLVAQTSILAALTASEHGVDLCPALKHFAIVSPEKQADAAVLQQTAACLRARLERGLRLSRLSVYLCVYENWQYPKQKVVLQSERQGSFVDALAGLVDELVFTPGERFFDGVTA